MRAIRSFRARLAFRFGATVLLVTVVASTLAFVALRRILYDDLDRSLERLAEIEAAATADSPDESVHFHDELFINASDREATLTRYAQVWTVAGEPVVRTRNLAGRDLPIQVDLLRRVASSGTAEFLTFRWEGQRYRGLLYPLGLVGPQHALHVLEVAAPTEQAEAVLGYFLRMLALLVLAGTVVASALGWWMAGHAVRPVLEIIEQAELLDPTRADGRITAHAEADELTRLVSVLNSMLARIGAVLENQRRFLADAGHEIKTPLTILRGNVELSLRKERSPAEYRAVLEQTLADLRITSSLAEDLITLARSESGDLEPRMGAVALEELMTKVAERYEQAAARAGVRLEIEVAPRLTVKGDAALLERALSNLVDNAIKYAGGSTVRLFATPAQEELRIGVSDDGQGIPAEEKAHLFERFYRGTRGRRAALGSGLGLAIVKAIVESHGGRTALESEPGQGTTVTLVLPAKPIVGEPAAPLPEGAQGVSTGGRGPLRT